MNLTREMALVIISALAACDSESLGYHNIEAEVTIVRCIDAFYPDLLNPHEYLPCVKLLRERLQSPFSSPKPPQAA